MTAARARRAPGLAAPRRRDALGPRLTLPALALALPGVAGVDFCGYTSSMKTAISLPDDVFQEAERLARRLKKSRSELYREAVAEYVARHDPEAITEAMNRLAGEVCTGVDEFTSAAARRVLEHTEW